MVHLSLTQKAGASIAKWWCGGMLADMATGVEAGAEVVFQSPRSIWYFVMQRRVESVSHLWCCWCGCSRIWSLSFFHSLHNLSFFYPLLASHSSERKSQCPEDLAVRLVRAWFVLYTAELWGGESEFPWVSWDPLLREEVATYLHAGGDGRADNLIGFLCCFSLFTVEIVAEESLLKTVTWEKISVLMKH